MPVIAPLKFELRYRREAYKVVGGKLVRDAERDATLPERPPQFTPLIGDFSTVHDRASELNDAQVRSGFTQQADPRMFECPVCDSQYTSRLAAAECCDPAWEDT